MGTVYLVRHGQASFGADDYDVLSDLGIVQSRALGAYWAARGVRMDAWYTGPSRRQRDTARYIGDGARAAGVEHTAATRIDDLDEFPAFQLLARWLPRLEAEHPEFSGLTRAWTSEVERPRLGRAFAILTDRWVRNELDELELESFGEFLGRVRRGLAQVMADVGRKRSVAIVTSAGPIAMAMQWALALESETAMRLAWVIGNTAISEFRCRGSQALTLHRFNTVPHLQDDALITYR